MGVQRVQVASVNVKDQLLYQFQITELLTLILRGPKTKNHPLFVGKLTSASCIHNLVLFLSFLYSSGGVWLQR